VEEEGEEGATFHLKLGNIDVARNHNLLCMQEFCEHFFIENVEMEQKNNMTMFMQIIKNQLSHKRKCKINNNCTWFTQRGKQYFQFFTIPLCIYPSL
jgi:hypothetical protein